MKTTDQFKSGSLVRIYAARHFDEQGTITPALSEVRGADALGVWFSNQGDAHKETPVNHRFIPWAAIVEVEFL